MVVKCVEKGNSLLRGKIKLVSFLMSLTYFQLPEFLYGFRTINVKKYYNKCCLIHLEAP